MTNNPAELTAFDPQILKLLIQNKMYSWALERYNVQPTVFNPELGLMALDVMSFFYYYGYACTALKMYNQALQAFRKVLIQPTSIVHKCMLNAYKKYIIVSLLADKFPDFPKKCNENMVTFIPKLASLYKNLADAIAIVHSLFH